MTGFLNSTTRDRLLRLPFWTLGYFGIIVLANMMLLWFEPIFLAGSAIPPAILASGFVFVLRDFAQREIGHFVLIAILAAAGATFWLAGPEIALASSSAFLIAELADWIIYSVTKRPMSDRVLISSLISVPVDTAVFYALLGILDPLALTLGIAIKLVGACVFWGLLSLKEAGKARSQQLVGRSPAATENSAFTQKIGTRRKPADPFSEATLAPNEFLGSANIECLDEYVADYAALMVERTDDGFDVYLLARGDDATIQISMFVRDTFHGGDNRA